MTWPMTKQTTAMEVYPGTETSKEELLVLADHYREAAEIMYRHNIGKGLLSLAPTRLCAIHAVELYLNAFLRHLGFGPDAIRAMQHDLTKRCELAREAKLMLRKRTIVHLSEMTEAREYLLSRYAPALLTSESQISRVMATLADVSKKVRVAVDRSELSIKKGPVSRPLPDVPVIRLTASSPFW